MDGDDARRESAILDALFTQAPFGLFLCDAELRVVRFNSAAPGVHGVPPERILGRTLADLVAGLTDEPVVALAEEALRTGAVVRDRLFSGRPPADPDRDMTVSVSLFRLEGAGGEPIGLVVVVEDVTEREAALGRLSLLNSARESIGTSLDAYRTAAELVDVLVPGLADAAAVDLLDDALRGRALEPGPVPADTPLRRAAFRSVLGDERGPPKGGLNTFGPHTPYSQVLNDLTPRLITGVDAGDAWLGADPSRGDPIVSVGVHSLMVVPLTLRETVLGVAALYRFARPEPFGDTDLALAAELVTKAALHLGNACSFARERTVARALQQGLMPGRPPELTAVDTACAYLPESAGGDWYDVIPLSGARAALVVGDVAGHGIEAAATMGQLRTALRTLALQDLEPGELLGRLDETAAFLTRTRSPVGQGDETTHDHLATCVCVVYDPVSRVCTAARAGHPLPVMLGPDGSALDFDIPCGPPLGTAGAGYPSAATVLPESTLLALYTSGLVNCGGGDGATSLARLDRILAQPDESLARLCDSAVYELMPRLPREDAVLLLARTRALPPDRVTSWTLPRDASVVSTARRLIEHQLQAWEMPDAVSGTELIVSELLSNAIRYGQGPIRLRVILDRSLICEVSDASSTSPHMRHATETDEGGRGLFIVMQLSDRWGTRTTGDGKTIWSEQVIRHGPAR
ncbi:SpoIIE family protein phosphatase [Streptomyces sp. I6]|uniref:ATP-binding SpoIIE family protein phosphatase n=1 Tax=Streptomyces sp. I6 TaxID=2483113 RepID=UPI000F45B910|nr:SpoIIE family protein phosphatase [Streptomyces sp. I6]RNL70166.1 PAS domain S-box protein [Streptomyces sp. I6]